MIKGPGIFLAQFAGDEAPFNNLESICKWAADLGYKAVQIPTWDSRLFDLDKAGQSKDYCDEIQAVVNGAGLEIADLSTHLQGQLVAVHPAYDSQFDGFAPPEVRGNRAKRTEWAVQQLMSTANASSFLGLKNMVTFPGALLWPTMYPWPQRPKGLVETGFAELAKRWLPILNHFKEKGVGVCYEIHPGEDIHDGVTFERFLEATDNHAACKILYDPSHFILQQLDYLKFIDYYHEHINMFHVKDAEFVMSGKSGVYGGYQEWKERPGRFRSLGDGQIDFNSIFSKLTQYGFDGWAVMEWECCLKSSDQGAKEGAPFIENLLIDVATTSFDDFAGSESNEESNRKILGL